MASKKAGSKGKRYTADEKQVVVDFVNNYNAANGRGGVTAAVKKFGASPLSIGSWVNSGPAPAKAPKANGKGTASTASANGKRGNVLGELSKLDQVISVKRKELEVLESRFQKLKASL